MPDRIVRAGILTSDSVNSLSWASEVFYRRLMNAADDYGRYDGRSSILRAVLYPLKLDRVSDRDIETWIAEVQEAGLITIYSVEGKQYLEIKKFDQRLRCKKSKWPPPPSSDGRCQRMSSNATESDTDTDTDTDKNVPKFSEEDFRLAERFLHLIRQLNSKHKQPRLEKWADEVRLMREQDEHTHDEIIQLFEWVNKHHFWKINILSPGKLREKWDILTLQRNVNGGTNAPRERVDNSAPGRVRVANGIRR